MTRRQPLAVVCSLALLVAGPTACGGDDDSGDGGSGDAVASIESCLEDAGLKVQRTEDVNSLDSELVAAGAIHQFVALDLDQQEYSYGVIVFSAPDKAAAYAVKQQAEFEKQPELKFEAKGFGRNVVSTTTDAPKRADVQSCAEDSA